MSSATEALLTDMAFDRDKKVASHGDVDVVSGAANVNQRLLHRLMTVPGTLLHRPNFGVGIQNYQNAPLTLGVKRQLALRIRDQFLLDPGVDQVSSIAMDGDDIVSSQLIITVKCKIKGLGEATLSFLPFEGQVVAQ